MALDTADATVNPELPETRNDISRELTPADLWCEVVGQEHAVAQLRAAVRSPVHAYLLSGPAGSGKRAAARAFGAELLSINASAEEASRNARLASAEQHPSILFVEREGASIDVGQARDIVRRSALTPPEGDCQVLVLIDFHLVTDAGPILLKALEEPPESTYFVILAEEVPPELATVASRCVRIGFTPVATEAVARCLEADGVDQAVAEMAAWASGGNVERARLLVADPNVTARKDAWYHLPEHLDGTGATVMLLVGRLLELVDGALEPLDRRQHEELAEVDDRIERLGEKGTVRKHLEVRHGRERRRLRTDELRFGLGVIAGRYRDQLTTGGGEAEFLQAGRAIQELTESLVHNRREDLALEDLLIHLPPLPAPE
ncbi:MAG: hypothetical protein JJLCMIEE_01504 [Acidimicrobiales bacterium]|nr:hypothetical protein [Acidimicrobiales bacterium]